MSTPPPPQMTPLRVAQLPQVSTSTSSNVSPVFKRTTPLFPAVLALFCCFCIFIAFAPPRWGADSGLAAIIDKHNRLETCKSPKIVFVGGSNVLMGLDSAKIQKALKRDVVNMGLGISLGLRYQLEETKSDIKAGDTVVIIPEYCNFYFLSKDVTNAHFDGSYELLYLAQVYPRAWQWIGPMYLGSPTSFANSLDDARRFISFKAQFYRKVLVQLAHSPKMLWSKTLLEPTSSIFTRRSSINSYGDFVAHLNLPNPTLPIGDPISSHDYEKFNWASIKFLNDFEKFAREKGADVVIIPPVFVANQKSDAIADDIYRHWKKSLKIPILAAPNRYFFPRSELFDSEYHTNAQGRQQRTARVIEDLTTFLAVSKHSRRQDETHPASSRI